MPFFTPPSSVTLSWTFQYSFLRPPPPPFTLLFFLEQKMKSILQSIIQEENFSHPTIWNFSFKALQQKLFLSLESYFDDSEPFLLEVTNCFEHPLSGFLGRGRPAGRPASVARGGGGGEQAFVYPKMNTSKVALKSPDICPKEKSKLLQKTGVLSAVKMSADKFGANHKPSSSLRPTPARSSIEPQSHREIEALQVDVAR